MPVPVSVCTVLQPAIHANITPKANNLMGEVNFRPKSNVLQIKAYAQQLRF